ncbi:hypothetical protein GCM10022220_14790 [Actinocatenispora rupis]|uniref:S1C family serine protease n=1 Tax=Actinocatenispora rupis TaxID=519421 RepID=UPI0031E7412C
MSEEDRDTSRADEPAAAESTKPAQPDAGAAPAAPATPRPAAANSPAATSEAPSPADAGPARPDEPTETLPAATSTGPTSATPATPTAADTPATPAAATPAADGTPAVPAADTTPAAADATPSGDESTEILPSAYATDDLGAQPTAAAPHQPAPGAGWPQPGQPGGEPQPGVPAQPSGEAQPGVPGQPGGEAQWPQPAGDQPGWGAQSDPTGSYPQPGTEAAFAQPGQPGRAGQPGQPGGEAAFGHPGQPGPTGEYPTQQVPPMGPGGWQQPGPYGQQPPKRPARRWLAAGAAALVLVLGGGVVGGVTVHALGGNGVTESPVVSSPVSSKGGSLADMVAQVQPSVVSLKVQPDGSQSGDEGSGVVIRSDGMILTNNHVVSSVADGGGTITVTFSDGKQASAKVVGTDPAGDLAVVQAQRQSGLKPATLGDSSKMRVGDGVVAIGSPLGLEGSVTEGIVSALNRSYSVAAEDQQPQQQNQNPFNFGQPKKNQQNQQNQGGGSTVTIPNAIQTDAAINPGNSGGPLLNMAGQVIGINSAIRGSDSSSGQAGNIGIGFAIPINTAHATANQLIQGKKVQHALFGVKVGDAVSDGQGASGTPQGALVADVTKGGPAAKAGLKKGDVITSIDGTKVTDSASLVSIISEHKPGDKVKVTYTRNGSSKTTTATLTKSPN